jgi:hypothetical protein
VSAPKDTTIAAAVMMAGLAGCGGEDPDTDRGGDVPTEPAEPTEDEVESDLPEGVPTAPPERPTPDEETLESAEAFSRYVLEVDWYTRLSADTSAMEDLTPESGSCQQCAALFELVDDFLVNPGLVARPVEGDLVLEEPHSASLGDSVYEVLWAVTRPLAERVDRETGEHFRNLEPLPAGSAMSVKLLWTDEGWELFEYLWEGTE